MKTSDETKKNRYLSVLFLVLSLVTLYGPLVYYIITGLVVAHTASKVILSLFAVAAIIVAIICFIQKHKLRSPLWLLILGIFFAVEHVLPLIIIVAVATIMDEFIFTPLHKLYKQRAQTNHEIDRRINK